MSDTAPRNPVRAPQMLADALLRGVGGTSAQLRVAGSNPDANQADLGLIATTFSEVVVGPVVMRKLRNIAKGYESEQFEMLVSATSVQKQVNALELSSAQALFAMTLAITVTGSDYLIESVASNEAFGSVYLYRLILRQASRQSI